jgi:hypothetical protein
MGKTKEQSDYEKRLEEKLLHDWDVIRRHPDYRKFCDNHKFDNDGRLTEEQSQDAEAENIKRRFGLMTIYHYSSDLNREQCFQCFEGDLFASPQSVIWIHPESLPTNKKFLVWPEPIDEQASDPGSQWDEYIYLVANIGPEVRERDFILEALRRFRQARHVRKIEPDRQRFRSDPEVFRVWDEYQRTGSYRETMKAVWPEEYKKERPKNDVTRSKLYEELLVKYNTQGLVDADDLAYREAYGDNDEDESSSGIRKLYMRVSYQLDKMKKALATYDQK